MSQGRQEDILRMLREFSEDSEGARARLAEKEERMRKTAAKEGNRCRMRIPRGRELALMVPHPQLERSQKHVFIVALSHQPNYEPTFVSLAQVALSLNALHLVLRLFVTGFKCARLKCTHITKNYALLLRWWFLIRCGFLFRGWCLICCEVRFRWCFWRCVVSWMRRELSAASHKLSAAQVTGKSGMGMVQATLGGDGRLLKLHVSPQIGKDGLRVIEDLVAAAVNQAHDRLLESTRAEVM